MTQRVLVGLAVAAAFVVAFTVAWSIRDGGSPKMAPAASRSAPVVDPGDSNPGPAVQEPQDGPDGQGPAMFVDRWVPSSFDDLVKASQLIVVGTVAEAADPRVEPIGGAPFGDKRVRDYSVDVQRVLKGDAPATITVTQLMGMRFVGEGPIPDWRDFLPLTVGDQYALFLRPVLDGAWGAVEAPYRYRLVDGEALPEMGVDAAAALTVTGSPRFPSVTRTALLARIAEVAASYPDPISIGVLQQGDDPPPVALDFPEAGDRINLVRSLGLNVPAALAIEDGFSFKWGAQSRAGGLDDPALLRRLSSALDTPLTLESLAGDAPLAGALPLVIFTLSEPIDGSSTSTMGFAYDFSQGLLILDEPDLELPLQMRLPAEARAILDEVIGIG